jgi:hypothetical protein
MRFKLPFLVALFAITNAVNVLAFPPKPTPMRVACGLVLGEPLTIQEKMSSKEIRSF